MRATLLALAASAALATAASAGDFTYQLGLGASPQNLLGQTGVRIPYTTASPWGEVQHASGIYVSGYAFLTTNGVWKREYDYMLGIRRSSGQVDWDCRIADYDVDAGKSYINIFNVRCTAGYTVALASATSLRFDASLDDEYAIKGFAGATRNLLMAGLGATLSHKFTPTLKVWGRVESWLPANLGYLENKDPNVKGILGVEKEITKNVFASLSGGVMQHNNFDHTNRAPIYFGGVGLRFVFGN